MGSFPCGSVEHIPKSGYSLLSKSMSLVLHEEFI